MKVVCFLSLVCVAILSGCLPLANPISDPMLSSHDTDICGVWQATSAAAGSSKFLFVGVRKGEEGAPQGLMKMCNAEYDAEAKEMSAATYEFFVTELKGKNYANLLINGSSISSKSGYDAWKQGDNHSVGLVKYQVKNGELTVWMADEAAWTAIEKDQPTKGAAGLVEYIKAHGDAAVFPDSKKTVFRHLR